MNTTLQVDVSMRVRDVELLIAQRWGGVAELRAYLDHAHDPAAYLLWDAADEFAGQPDRVVDFTHILIGNPADVLRIGKLDLLGLLMASPGMGIRELARRARKNPATVLEQVVQLERAGLVARDAQGPRKRANIRPLVQKLTITLGGP